MVGSDMPDVGAVSCATLPTPRSSLSGRFAYVAQPDNVNAVAIIRLRARVRSIADVASRSSSQIVESLPTGKFHGDFPLQACEAVRCLFKLPVPALIFLMIGDDAATISGWSPVRLQPMQGAWSRKKRRCLSRRNPCARTSTDSRVWLQPLIVPGECPSCLARTC